MPNQAVGPVGAKPPFSPPPLAAPVHNAGTFYEAI